MGGAMVEGWRAGGLDLSGAVVIRPSGTPVDGVRTVRTLAEAGSVPKLIILGFKPQKLDEVAPELNRWVTSKATIVSILAGVEAETLHARFPKAGTIVRAMPNLPVAVRRGVIGLYSADADHEVRNQLAKLVGMLGWVAWLPDEAKYSALGAIAGAGPAYVARFIGALARAGEALGLDPAVAGPAALETVVGTSWLGTVTRESMDEIARRVASPKGTTEAGLAVLDGDHALDRLIADTIEAAADRGRQLAEEARRH
jgi:pyrroline-5-carboxylate reductase